MAASSDLSRAARSASFAANSASYFRRVDSMSGAASDSVSLISLLHLGHTIVGSRRLPANLFRVELMLTIRCDIAIYPSHISKGDWAKWPIAVPNNTKPIAPFTQIDTALRRWER